VAKNEFGVVCPGTPACTPGEAACEIPVDCKGKWSECTIKCEKAPERTFTTAVAMAHFGKVCPLATACTFG